MFSGEEKNWEKLGSCPNEKLFIVIDSNKKITMLAFGIGLSVTLM